MHVGVHVSRGGRQPSSRRLALEYHMRCERFDLEAERMPSGVSMGLVIVRTVVYDAVSLFR
jgi:hypothetical protein